MARQSLKLSVNDMFRVKWLVGATMATVSVSSLFNLENHTLLPGGICFAVLLICIAFPKLYVSAPPILWKLLAFSIVPMVSIDVFAKETVAALLNLNTWLVLYRGLNHQKRREEMQLVLLCLFLLVMAGMLTTSLVIGLQLLIFTGLAMAFLTSGTLLESKSQGKSEEIDPREAWKHHKGWMHLSKRMRYRNLAIGSAMLASLLGLAALAFLFIPRVDLDEKVDLFKMRAVSSQTGFSESVQLGEVTNIKKDNRVALRVDVAGRNFVPAMPYWRMLALDEYKEGGFSVSPALKEMLEQGQVTPYNAIRFWSDRSFADAPSQDSRRDRWTFFLEPGVSKFLPVLGSFRQLTFSDLEKISIGPYEYAFSLEETPSKMVSYQLEGIGLSATIPAVDAYWHLQDVYLDSKKKNLKQESDYPKTLLELSMDSASREFIDRVVDEIRQDLPMTALDFASRATEYLASNHGYSLNSALPTDTELEDPIARWMKAGLDGHCEFFASSLVLLSRAAGFQARLAIGFKGGSWNAFENYYMIRNSDAHAWVEINDGHGSWLRVDPTPGSGLPTAAPQTIALGSQVAEGGSRAYLDSLRMLWYRRIVNFDEQAQKEAAIQVKDFMLAYLQIAEEWATKGANELYGWIVAPWSMRKFATTSLSLIIAVLVLIYQRNLALNYRELLLAPFKRGDPIRRKASKLLKRSERSAGETREDLAARRKAVISELQRLRFGPKESWKEPRIVFREARRLL
jgi:transglutaminase-like putative cysteine protease